MYAIRLGLLGVVARDRLDGDMAGALAQSCVSSATFLAAVCKPTDGAEGSSSVCSARFPARKPGGLRKLAQQQPAASRQAAARACNSNSKSGAWSSSDNGSGRAKFYKVEAVVRPWRLNLVAAALLREGIRGVTVTDVRGFGAQGGSRERQAGSEFTEGSFVSKVKMEIVVCQEQVETVVDIIIGEARTGEIGDGKIWLTPVDDIIRIRTGERGLEAERMAGGRAELLSSEHSPSL